LVEAAEEAAGDVAVEVNGVIFATKYHGDHRGVLVILDKEKLRKRRRGAALTKQEEMRKDSGTIRK
jgi:hypothetical protein